MGDNRQDYGLITGLIDDKIEIEKFWKPATEMSERLGTIGKSLLKATSKEVVQNSIQSSFLRPPFLVDEKEFYFSDLQNKVTSSSSKRSLLSRKKLLKKTDDKETADKEKTLIKSLRK